jgi:hypothetical protein
MVVALLPSVFEFFPYLLEVGSAGHNGFLDDEGRRFETRFVRGGHSAGIDRKNYPAIVNFIFDRPGCLDGQTRLVDCPGFAIPKPNYSDRQSQAAVLINRFCVVIWAFMLAALAGILAWMLKRIRHRERWSVGTLAPPAAYVGFIFVALRFF